MIVLLSRLKDDVALLWGIKSSQPLTGISICSLPGADMDSKEISEPSPLASLSDRKRRKLKAAQIRRLYAQSGIGSLGVLLGAVIFAGALWEVVSHDRLIAWISAYVLLVLGRHYLIRSFQKEKPDEDAVIRWGKCHTVAACAGGLMWGVAGVWLFPENSIQHQLLFLIFVGAIGTGCTVIYSPTKDYAPNLVLALVPLSGRFIYEFDQLHMIIGILLLLFTVVLLLTARQMHKVYADSLMLRCDKDELVEELEQEIAHRDRLQMELRAAHDDLEMRVDARTNQLKNLNRALEQEITERTQVEEELSKSEEKYRVLAENATDIVWSLDLGTMKITYVSPSVQKILGYTPAEILESPLEEMFTPDSYATAIAMLDEQLGKEGAPGVNPERTGLFEFPQIRKDGSIIDTEARIKFLRDANGNPTGLLGITRDVTYRKRAKELLEKSEARYRLVVENASEMIGIVQDEKFVFSNVRGLEFSGYSEEELTGTPLVEFVYPDDRESALELHQEAMEREGATKPVAFRIIDKLGRVRWIHVSAVRIEWDGRAAVLVFGIEITELKQAEEALRESEGRFRALAEAAPFGIVLIKKGGTFQNINPKFRELFGYTLEDIPDGREWCRRAYPDTQYRHNLISAWIDEARRSTTGQFPPRIFTVRCKDGTEKAVNFIAVRLPSGEDMVACEDVTEKRRAEELAIRTERLKAIGDLAGGVAHNFNNLLQMVTGGIDFALVDLERRNLSGLKETLEELRQSSSLGSETVRRLQNFARMRDEIQPSEGEVLDLSEITKQAAEMTKPFWRTGPDKEGLLIALNLNLTDRCFVNAKESEIMEVLVNLVKNAVEALPTGGGIQIKTFCDGDEVIVQVSDDGEGIKKEHLKKVFEPFWSTKGESTGKGMGLAVSHGIIKRHRGTISVESKVGKGSTFTVRLPSAKEPRALPAPSGAKTLASKLNILVVDDVVIIVMHLKGLLTKHQQTVFSATSGGEALEIFKNNKIDMVICDLSMPGVNGWEVGKAIRAIGQQRGLPKTPFILLTGWGGQTLAEEKIIESGVDAVVEKPIDSRRLMATISEVAEKVFQKNSKDGTASTV